ncbi:fasciclin domain-containing protein [Luteimonas sp. Sa2BVA3]|uniref:Fasciclin domain-containing protein n=1 Tax=Luteimonas colneyensis TaxID=2762230 RepID=A0ABR8UKI0_9GAMM|nr:fasciclin domain-containing protein [Luteimonas colneyensis]MBD7988303.1 fasciclin domain-containing protein [Luteimonas colneyensis]
MHAPSRLRLLAAALAIGLAAPLAHAAPSGDAAASKPAQAKADIVDTAVAAGQFGTLAAALKAAGLVDTLKGPGPFTVFAPTDAAFAALPAGTVESLLKPENREQLTAILTYHVVPGRYPAARVAGIDSAATVNGGTIDIKADGGTVMVDEARVIQADVTATNGVIHVIDKVLMP